MAAFGLLIVIQPLLTETHRRLRLCSNDGVNAVVIAADYKKRKNPHAADVSEAKNGTEILQ